MGIIWLIGFVLVGFLITIWGIYQIQAKVKEAIDELIEVKTHLADISEALDDRAETEA